MRAVIGTVPAIVILLWSPVAAAQAPAAPEGPVVVTSGSAFVSRAPDRAFVTVATETRAPGPVEAQRKNAEAMTAVQARLKSAGIPTDAVRTTSYNLREDSDFVQGKRVPRGYVVTSAIEVRTDDLERLGALLDAVVASGANAINQVRFDLKNRAAVEREALALAVADARAKAEAAARGAGLAIGEILRVDAQDVRAPRPFPVAAMGVAGGVAADSPIAAGELEVHAQVTVTARLVRP